MSLIRPPSALQSALIFLTLPLILLAACGDSQSAPPRPVNEIFIGPDGGGSGCVQPSFPADHPDLSLSNPPRFLLNTNAAQQSSIGQAQVRRGELIEAEVTPNAATRRVTVEFADPWTPGIIIYREEFETSGGQLISIATISNVRGRYYMRLTLCGVDCEARRVVFEVVTCPEDSTSTLECGKNVPYQRTLIEDDEVIETVGTCFDLGENPGVGSGTVLIQ